MDISTLSNFEILFLKLFGWQKLNKLSDPLIFVNFPQHFRHFADISSTFFRHFFLLILPFQPYTYEFKDLRVPCHATFNASKYCRYTALRRL